MVKLSRTSKLGTYSWSLQAGIPADGGTCPGAVAENGDYVTACQGCYARTGMYHFGAVKKVRADNKTDWQRAEWVNDMVNALKKQTHMRWFDSGDLYSMELAEKIYQVAINTPNTKHWIPTRMAKFSKFKAILDKLNALDNVAVRFSSDNVNGEYGPENGSVIFDSNKEAPAGTFKCKAYENDGKCGSCRACYDKDIAVIAYPSHGRKMAKVIRIAAV
jgi:hypothetical protein